MRFLADENFPRPAVELLRRNGHEVLWVTEDSAGLLDEAILEKSNRVGVTLLTADKDFGELVFHRGMAASCGVVLFRIETRSPQVFAGIALEVLNTRDDWSGYFTVVENDRIRMRPLPKG